MASFLRKSTYEEKSTELHSVLSDVVNLHSGEAVVNISRTGTVCT